MRIQHYVKEGLADRKLGEFYQVFLLNFIHCRNNLWTSKEFIRKQVCRSYGSIEIEHYVYLQYRYFFSAVLRKMKLKKKHMVQVESKKTFHRLEFCLMMMRTISPSSCYLFNLTSIC